MSAGLLEKESTGGAVARVGFGYQDAFVLQHMPQWLSQGAFSHVVSEALGDVEVCYFAPRGGVLRVLHEAKDYALSSTEFWKEIDRFMTIHNTSPAESPHFVMVCRSYNGATAPLLAMLERLRGVGASFPADSVFLTDARRKVVEWVVNKGQAATVAEFVMDHVHFVTYASEHADAAFPGEVDNWLPSLNLRAKESAALRERCKELTARSSSGPVHRNDIEATVVEALGEDAARWTLYPTRVHLLKNAVPIEELGLDVSAFYGPDRAARTEAEWHELALVMGDIGEFVKNSRPRLCVALDGKQRMSLSCLMGYTFGATRGFILEIEHNGHIYRTDCHERADGPFFIETQKQGIAIDSEGVACIGFPTPVGNDVELVAGGGLVALPRLGLTSPLAIDGVATLNLAIAEAKAALVRFRSENRLDRLHLFIKAPSIYAMALGHRLNGIGAVQLYDWVEGKYLDTAVLC